MKNTLKKTALIMFLVLAVLLTVSIASAKQQPQEPVLRQEVTSCSGTGELLLYKGMNPFQIQEDIKFSTKYDQLLIMTRPKYNEWVKVKVDGDSATVNEFWKGNTPFDVTIFSVDTSSGHNIDFNVKVNNNGARGVQGFLLQNPDKPFFNDAFTVIYDGLGEEVTYLEPGTYNHIVFDRYTYNNIKDPKNHNIDNRKTTVTVTDSDNNEVYSKTFVGPNPAGTQGANVAEFDIKDAGYYTISVDSEDSVYWGITPCEPDEENEVPEFGFIGAFVAVAAIGGFALYRRKH